MYKLNNVSKSYNSLNVLKNFSIEIPEGKITAILGPSGCGKTTILNLFAKLIKADQGQVDTAGKISYLFQEPRLIPWLSVRDNITLVLKDQIQPAQRDAILNKVTKATAIGAYLNYYPHQLSGGIKQRVATARAFAYQAPLLLMDEPFKSLDLKTRFKLINDFYYLWQQEPNTVIMVTHDIKEALFLADQILVLSDKPCGIIEQLSLNLPKQERKDNEIMQSIEERIFELMLS